MQQQKNYFDAKPSYLETEIFTDCKNRIDFERVKQKFDGKPQNNAKIPSISNKFGNSSIPASSSSSKQQNSNSNLLRKHPNTATPATKINKNDLFDGNSQNASTSSSLNNKLNINETIQFFDNDSTKSGNLYQAGGSKEENAGNFNLDGFKVSEDDEDSDDVSIDIA